jgi:hypothetical protein
MFAGSSSAMSVDRDEPLVERTPKLSCIGPVQRQSGSTATRPSHIGLNRFWERLFMQAHRHWASPRCVENEPPLMAQEASQEPGAIGFNC